MANRRPNPYVGPRPFQTGETLYGREHETLELLDLLIAERIVLLYSPSGAGKTSLVQAALVPRLQAEGFDVLRPIRLNVEPPPDSTGNRYVQSALVTLEEGRLPAARRTLDQFTGLSLAAYLNQARATTSGSPENTPESTPTGAGASPEGSTGRSQVLIFDQFEEILTVDPTNVAAKEAFFAQLGELLRDRDRWALFAMREDYVAGLDPYLRPVPTRFSNTFRLDMLGADAAREAIQKPAHAAGVDFTDQAATRLIDDLRRVQVQRPDGTVEERLGPNVEPVQLQVVCLRLWEEQGDSAPTIDTNSLASFGDVNQALADYYANRVALAAQATGEQERTIREWVDRQLITEAGIRGQVLMEPERSRGLANEAIRALEDAHLVRAEERRGTTWFELSHDRLVGPIRADNAAWFNAHLTLLQRQADLWHTQGRPAGLLLRDAARVEAAAWAAAHSAELTQVEQDFLAECQAAHAAREREQAQNRRIRRLAVFATILSVVALLACIAAIFQWSTAVKAAAQAQTAQNAQATAAAVAVSERDRASLQSQIARTGYLAAQATNIGDTQIDLAALLSLESGNAAAGLAPVYHLDARGSLLKVMAGQSHPEAILRGHTDSVQAVAFSPDGNLLASGAYDGAVRLWDAAGGQPMGAPLLGHETGVSALAFSPDGLALATGDFDGKVYLWDIKDGKAAVRLSFDSGMDGVSAVAFDPTGTLLAIGGSDGALRLWDPASGQPAGDAMTGHTSWIHSLLFSKDGKTLISGSPGDATTIFWDVATRQASGEPLELYPSSLALSPDGRTLAYGTSGWEIGFVDIATRSLGTTFRTSIPNGPNALAYSPDGTTLAAAGEDGLVYLFDPNTGATVGEPFQGHTNVINSLAYSPDGNMLASGSDDTTLRLWDTSSRNRPVHFQGMDSEVWSSAISLDGEAVAHGSRNGGLWVWQADGTLLGDERARLPDWVIDVVFSPDGKLVAAGGCATKSGYGCAENEILVSDAATGAPVADLKMPGGYVIRLAFSPDGKRLAGGSAAQLQIWDTVGWQPLPGPSLPADSLVTNLRFSPDGRTLAVADGDQVAFWDTAAWQPVYGPVDHGSQVFSLAFSPDSKLLATAGGGKMRGDQEIRIWNVATGEPLGAPLVAHKGTVVSMAFSPDGQTLVSGSTDGTVRLWDVLTGRALGPAFSMGDVSAGAVAFAPDGGAVLIDANDNTLRRWETDEQVLRTRACRMANRNLTRAEWARYVDTDPASYQATCPGLPLEGEQP